MVKVRTRGKGEKNQVNVVKFPTGEYGQMLVGVIYSILATLIYESHFQKKKILKKILTIKEVNQFPGHCRGYI